MPFALIGIGVILCVVAFKNTQNLLGAQLVSDFTGSGNFVYWIASILAIGSLGYWQPMRGFSRAFLLLIVVAMLFSNKGFFAMFNASLQSGTAQPPASGNGAGSGAGFGDLLSPGGGGANAGPGSVFPLPLPGGGSLPIDPFSVF